MFLLTVTRTRADQTLDVLNFDRVSVNMVSHFVLLV